MGGGGVGIFDTTESPPPYRQGSSFIRDRSNIIISADKMAKSLNMTIKRDLKVGGTSRPKASLNKNR